MLLTKQSPHVTTRILPQREIMKREHHGALHKSLSQGHPTLFLEVYHPVGFNFNPSLAHLIQLISSSTKSLAIEGVLC